MKRIYSKLTFALIAMLFALVTGVNAQTWDFQEEGIGETDLTNLNADAANWEHESASSNDRYKNTAANIPNGTALTANGQELNFTKGLLFKINAADRIRLDNKNSRLALNGTGIEVTIKDAKAGYKLTVVCETSSKGTARGLNVTNVTPVSGSFNSTAAGGQTNVGTVTADGDITLTTTGGMYVYRISLVDPSEEEQGGTIPSTDNSVGLNVNKNQVLLTTSGNEVKYYNTENLTDIAIDKAAGTVTVNSNSFATPDVFTRSISNIAFSKQQETGAEGEFDNDGAVIQISEAKGWQESAYVKWAKFNGADSYNVYVDDNTTPIDGQLIREYKNYFRADVVGLKAGTHSLRIVPVANDAEISGANTATNLNVRNYLREGFAFQGDGASKVGAYNADGSLKEGAIVLYVTKDNFGTIKGDIVGDNEKPTQTGLGEILAVFEKGRETRPLAIRFIGNVTDVDAAQLMGDQNCLQLKGKSATSYTQVTFEGIGDDATLNGFGITLFKASGVEIRNLGLMDFEEDALQLKTCNYVWIHNVDFFYGAVGGASDQAKGDGSLDAKDKGTHNTYSFNHFWDSGKVSLCGMKSESGTELETYHHNWFDHTDSRTPRVRSKMVHVYNNYYDGVSKYGVGSVKGASIFVENNYFRHTKYPMLISDQGHDTGTFDDHIGGMIKSFGNVYAEKGPSSSYTPITHNDDATSFDCYEASSRNEQVPSSYKTITGGNTYNNFDTNGTLAYNYTLDAAQDVPAVVTGYYGAGRLNHGDFTWTFNNSIDDTDYGVNKELKSKILSYENTDFVRVLGDLGASSGETGEGGGSTGGGETGGGETGGETGGGETVDGEIYASFVNGELSSNAVSFFTVAGGKGSNHGSMTIGGTNYPTGLKLDSKGSISFTPSKDMTMTVYFTKKTNKEGVVDLKINGSKVEGTATESGDGYTITMTVTGGTTYELLKGTLETCVFYISLVPVSE